MGGGIAWFRFCFCSALQLMEVSSVFLAGKKGGGGENFRGLISCFESGV